ncbi:MAG: serine/threonine protein kinase [Myxococcales bacterium]|nr:serine/threonine protein kinase [Myxococcales bacterium]
MRRASVLQRASIEDTGASIVGKTAARNKPVGERRGADPWLGRLVDSRYRVEEILGRGGMGVVYKIKHQRMGKIAAMKVLHSEMAKNPEVVARFQREAEAVSRLAHPNTVQVFDFGTAEGALYLVMEYVRGQDMGALIDRDGAMSFKDAAPLLGQICGSLEEAHDLGVVHRDLKPENLLVSRTHSGQDFVKVLDFGLAKLTETEESASVTSAGSIVGTPYYMPPEQIRAEEEVDHRADIYSLGALIYRLVTADNAFNAKTPVGVLTKHLTDDVEPPSKRFPGLSIPPGLDTIVLKCMAKDPEDRYESIRALLDDIEQLYVELSSDTSDIRQPPTSWLADPGDGTTPVAAIFEAEVDHGMQDEMRLRRGDLDDFEKQLRRRRSVRLLGIPLLLLGSVAAALYFVLLRPESAHKSEQEPNNDLASATLVASGSQVTGFIGKRENRSTPDRDFYRLNTKPNTDGSDVINVSCSAPPNVDISIDLYDTNGKLMKHVDEAGVGEGEELRRWRASSAVIVSISGVPPEDAGILPTENVSDAYSLAIGVAPTDERLESEPNDSRADANELIVGTPVTGYLDTMTDVDVFRVSAQAGSYKFLISGGPDVPFEWRLDEELSWRGALKGTVDLVTGSTLAIRYKDGATETTKGATAPYTIDLRRAL